MARLTDEEKSELLRATKENPPTHQPRRPRLSNEEYFKFLEFAGHFTRREKPIDFSGNHWKL